ncbi:hypothetical protein FB451DRAFT_1450850 [Mycena latifolia]|nr:hypothetical protein FB451DRAFT_1450850 [Mycena latifolia]
MSSRSDIPPSCAQNTKLRHILLPTRMVDNFEVCAGNTCFYTKSRGSAGVPVGEAGWYNSGPAKGLGPEFEILSGADHRHHAAINSLLNDRAPSCAALRARTDEIPGGGGGSNGEHRKAMELGVSTCGARSDNVQRPRPHSDPSYSTSGRRSAGAAGGVCFSKPDFYRRQFPALGLIPGHIIMATTAREKPAINIYALEALEPLWQPVDNLNFLAPTKTTADPLHVLALPMKSQPTWVLGLFVHASRLRWDTFQVTAHVEYSPSWSMADRAVRRGVAQLSYNAALDSDQREWAAYVSSGRTSDDVQEMRQLSNAGYAVDGRTHRLSRSAKPPRILEGAEQCKLTHLYAYSGPKLRRSSILWSLTTR